MSKVIVKPITDTSISVRKKVVHRDMENNWVTISELSPSEAKAFQLYKEEVLDPQINPLPVKTYNF